MALGIARFLCVGDSYETTIPYFLPFPSQNVAKVPKFHTLLFVLSPFVFHSLPMNKSLLPGVWLEYMVYGREVPSVGLSKQKHVDKVADSILIR